MSSLILDSEAFSALARARSEGARAPRLHAALVAALATDAEVVVPAAVLAEQYRGGSHDQIADAFLARHPFITIVDTDRKLARIVGNILARAGLGSAHHVDATVVATAVTSRGGVIVTGDPHDLNVLAAELPGVRIEAL